MLILTEIIYYTDNWKCAANHNNNFELTITQQYSF